MLPLFNEPTKLLLQQNQVIYRIPSAKQQGSLFVKNNHKDIGSSGKNVNWTAVMDCLNAHASRLFDSKASVEIYIASEFIRYLALPAQSDFPTVTERYAYAVAAFEEIHESLVEDWQIALMDVLPSRATLAAAIDRKFVESLMEMAARTKIKLRLITPAFSDVVLTNYARKSNQSGYLISLETNHMLVAEFVSGEISRIVNFRRDDCWHKQIQDYLKRASLDGGYKRIWWHAPDTETLSFGQVSGWSVHRIPYAWSFAQNIDMSAIRQAI